MDAGDFYATPNAAVEALGAEERRIVNSLLKRTETLASQHPEVGLRGGGDKSRLVAVLRLQCSSFWVLRAADGEQSASLLAAVATSGKS